MFSGVSGWLRLDSNSLQRREHLQSTPGVDHDYFSSAGGRAEAVGDLHSVGAGIGRLDIGQRKCCLRRPGDRDAVEIPLVAQGTASGQHPKRGAVAGKDGYGGRLRDNGGRDGALARAAGVVERLGLIGREGGIVERRFINEAREVLPDAEWTARIPGSDSRSRLLVQSAVDVKAQVGSVPGPYQVGPLADWDFPAAVHFLPVPWIAVDVERYIETLDARVDDQLAAKPLAPNPSLPLNLSGRIDPCLEREAGRDQVGGVRNLHRLAVAIEAEGLAINPVCKACAALDDAGVYAEYIGGIAFGRPP